MIVECCFFTHRVTALCCFLFFLFGYFPLLLRFVKHRRLIYHNATSLGVCYEDGLDENGKAVDTRTPCQKEALHSLVHELL